MAETAPVKNNSSRLLMYLLLAVLVLLAFGGWYAYDKNHKSAKNSSAAQSVPAGWSAYKNTQYGFTFIYPDTWGSPSLSVTPADKGQSYSIVFIRQNLSPQDQAKQPTVSMHFDSKDLSRKICAANDQNDCTTQTAFTSDNVKTALKNKSSFTISDSNSGAIVSVGPTPSSQVLSSQQIVSLTKADSSAVRANYIIQNADKSCTQNAFSPNSMMNCITQNTYDTVNKVLKSIQNV